MIQLVSLKINSEILMEKIWKTKKKIFGNINDLLKLNGWTILLFQQNVSFKTSLKNIKLKRT